MPLPLFYLFHCRIFIIRHAIAIARRAIFYYMPLRAILFRGDVLCLFWGRLHMPMPFTTLTPTPFCPCQGLLITLFRLFFWDACCRATIRHASITAHGRRYYLNGPLMPTTPPFSRPSLLIGIAFASFFIIFPLDASLLFVVIDYSVNTGFVHTFVHH